MDTQTETQKRKRKALLVLPLIALPFVALAFWSLGGGKATVKDPEIKQQGLNTSLPAAQLSGSPQDKMSLYDKAVADSQTLEEHMRNDPYGGADSLLHPANNKTAPITINAGSGYTDPNEVKVQAKLAQLQQVINQQPHTAASNGSYSQSPVQDENTKADIARLEQMMQSMQHQDNAPDPEMAQMNGMLDKLLDIQHPDRMQQQLREQSLKNRGRVYAVEQPQGQDKVSLLVNDSNPAIQSGNGFYDLDGQDAADTLPAAVPAVVQGTQTVTSGATIKLRLTADILVSGVVIPKDNFIYGSCSVDGERLKIQLTGVRYNNHLFPVSLSVYDLDALEGIRIPGAISRDASKEGADRAVQSVELMSMDPSLGAQAATAGVEAAKGLISKKVKLVRVTVKAGYPVLLLDEKAKQKNNF